jgi:ABC-type sulfate transport system permease component
VTGTLPVVLASLILGGGFELAFPLALSFMLTSLISLVIFATIEQPAREKAVNQGWTEQDARTSGL